MALGGARSPGPGLPRHEEPPEPCLLVGDSQPGPAAGGSPPPPGPAWPPPPCAEEEEEGKPAGDGQASAGRPAPPGEEQEGPPPAPAGLSPALEAPPPPRRSCCREEAAATEAPARAPRPLGLEDSGTSQLGFGALELSQSQELETAVTAGSVDRGQVPSRVMTLEEENSKDASAGGHHVSKAEDAGSLTLTPVDSLHVLHLSGQGPLFTGSSGVAVPSPDSLQFIPLIVPRSPTEQSTDGKEQKESLDVKTASLPQVSTPVSHNVPSVSAGFIPVPSQPEFSHDTFLPTPSLEEGLETQAETGDPSEALGKVTAVSSTEDCIYARTLPASEHSRVTQAKGRTLQGEEKGTVTGDIPAELSSSTQQGLNKDDRPSPALVKGSAFAVPVGPGDGACISLGNQPCQGSFLGKGSLEYDSIPEMPGEERREIKCSGDEGSSFHLMLSQEPSLCQEDKAAIQIESAAASARESSQNLPQGTQNMEGLIQDSVEEAEAAREGRSMFLRACPGVLKCCDSQPHPDMDSKGGQERVSAPSVSSLPAGIPAGRSSEECCAEVAQVEEGEAVMRARPGRMLEGPADGESVAVLESPLVPDRNLPLPRKGEEVLTATLQQQRAHPVNSERHEESQEEEESGVLEEEKQLQEKASDVPASLPAETLFRFTLLKEEASLTSITPPFTGQLKKGPRRHSTPIVIGNCPDSTIATSDVTAEGATDVTVESTVTSVEMEGSLRGDSAAVRKDGGMLSLCMNLSTPVTEESESLPFSLEKPAASERKNGSVADAVASSKKTPSVFTRICETQQEDKIQGPELPCSPIRGELFNFPSSQEEEKRPRKCQSQRTLEPLSGEQVLDLKPGVKRPVSCVVEGEVMAVVAAGAQEEEGSRAWKIPSSALPTGGNDEDQVLPVGRSSKGVQTAAATAAFLCDPAAFVSAATQTAPCSQVEVGTSTAGLKPTSDPGKEPEPPDNQSEELDLPPLPPGKVLRRHIRTIREVHTVITRVITDVYYKDGVEVERKVVEV